MSNLQSYDYPGWGEWAKEHLHYTQAIRIGDRIICSGQGGWSPSTPSPSLDNFIPASLSAEIDQAFSNVSHTLKSAGGEGWTQVYKIVTYSTDIPAQHERIVENLRKWMPGHRAVWTEVGVKMLGVEEMRFEVEVEAWDGEGMAE